MKKTLISTLAILFCATLYPQVPQDTIQTVKKGMGTRYMMNGTTLTWGELISITGTNAQASEEIKAARRNSSVANIFAGAGGFMMGWPLGTAIGGGEPNWTLFGIGVATALVSVPFVISSQKHLSNGIKTYNRGVGGLSFRETKLILGSSPHGLGFEIVF